MEKMRKLKRALERLDSYGAPSDDSPVMIDEHNTLFELIDGEEGPVLTLGDLRDIVREY